MNDPWLTPFDRTVQPGLDKIMAHHADGHTTILRPRRSSSITPGPEDEELIPAVVAPCVPALALGIIATGVEPFSTPFAIGDVVDMTPDSATGTAPLTYEWRIGGVLRSSVETYSYTVEDADITAKDEFGVGIVTFELTVKNSCNEEGSIVSGSISAQGTPP